MKQLESEQQFESLKQGATVFEFTAGWCPDCRVIEPDLPELEARYPMFDFVSVDRDKFMDICIENGIMGIPRKERKSIEQIDAFLAQYV